MAGIFSAYASDEANEPADHQRADEAGPGGIGDRIEIA